MESLLKNRGHQIQIFVVDNASRAEEVQVLRDLGTTHPEIHLICNPENVGYFSGLSIGIEFARKFNPNIQWMIIGNNDLEFPDGICSAIEEREAEYKGYAVISPDVVTLDGHHQNPHVILPIGRIRTIFYDLYYSNYYFGLLMYRAAKTIPKLTRRGDEDHWRTAMSIHQGHGSVYVLTPRFFSKFKHLWSPSFLFSEEFFLAVQLKRAGEQIFYSPAISVTHHWHGSLQDLPSRSRWNMARDAHRESRKYFKEFRA
ncbi:hypothetical protein AT984_02160 [Paucibacter sp. KCTC 42545]|nr:hypothetical protein AT984_02160 [Paucibacter sp. KCTC 42545]